MGAHNFFTCHSSSSLTVLVHDVVVDPEVHAKSGGERFPSHDNQTQTEGGGSEAVRERSALHARQTKHDGGREKSVRVCGEGGEAQSRQKLCH